MCPALLILNLDRSPSRADLNFPHPLSSMPPLMVSLVLNINFCGQETNASPWTGLSPHLCPLFNSSHNTFPSHTYSQGLPHRRDSRPAWLRKGRAAPRSRRALTPATVLLITSSLLPRASCVALSELPVISRLTLQLLAVWGTDCHFISCTAPQ